ncbi:MAG: hypothetical protein RL489_3283 [Pseudomonadota bacterium]|jgi:NitT/TauT family transport system permease protein
MNTRQMERWSPWILLVAVLLLWQALCSAFGISEFIFPSPAAIGTALAEHAATIAGHAWRTFWLTSAPP